MSTIAARAKARFQKNAKAETPETAETALPGVLGVRSEALLQKTHESSGVFGGASLAPFAENDVSRLPYWRLIFADREPAEVTLAPPVDRAEAMRWYPEAIDAAPVNWCRMCAHYRRPAQSDGCCAARDNLPVGTKHDD